jgi:hypothetical protein
MAKETTLQCHKCGGPRNHVKIHVGDLHNGHPFLQNIAAPLSEAALKVVNAGDWMGWTPYMCKSCGHFRNRGNKCEDRRCWS